TASSNSGRGITAPPVCCTTSAAPCILSIATSGIGAVTNTVIGNVRRVEMKSMGPRTSPRPDPLLKEREKNAPQSRYAIGLCEVTTLLPLLQQRVDARALPFSLSFGRGSTHAPCLSPSPSAEGRRTCPAFLPL